MTAERSCLIVDDDPMISAVTGIALQKEGFVCDTASNAHEAEELLGRHHFDVMVTDLRMPGKNGHALSVELAGKPVHPMIVVLTGCHEPRLAKDLLKRGIDDVMFKPVDYQAFAAKVRALHDRNQRQHADDQEMATRDAAARCPQPSEGLDKSQSQDQAETKQSKEWQLTYGD